VFRIDKILSLPFGEIAEKWYWCEGFETEGAFLAFWMKIHRGRMPADDQLRWLHVLQKVA
jgi:hypothetical protein